MTQISILDLSPITEGSNPGTALANSLDLIQHAERLGYKRYWVAEHHNMRGIASSATAVVIGHLAGGTSRIRVGAGGVMLPNHSPLVIAEQFGTLASLYPNRIDLGLGRAPGTDQITAHALRRTLSLAVLTIFRVMSWNSRTILKKETRVKQFLRFLVKGRRYHFGFSGRVCLVLNWPEFLGYLSCLLRILPRKCLKKQLNYTVIVSNPRINSTSPT